MRLEFDRVKDAINRDKHGLSLERASDFEFNTAVITLDTRYAYDEDRFRDIGFIARRLHMMVFTPRKDRIRVISLRKANQREVTRYAHHQRTPSA
jgi:hypothetical protein